MPPEEGLNFKSTVYLLCTMSLLTAHSTRAVEKVPSGPYVGARDALIRKAWKMKTNVQDSDAQSQ